MAESIGKRIAQLRQKSNLTQQALANRLAISRVAVSHIEMDISIPGERTITLMAGVFKISPHELVKGTTYPASKGERLPVSTCCYTKLELYLVQLINDLTWLNRLEDIPVKATVMSRLKIEIRDKWTDRLSSWNDEFLDGLELENIKYNREALDKMCGQ